MFQNIAISDAFLSRKSRIRSKSLFYKEVAVSK